MEREEVKTIVFRYIFIYYNRIRLYTGNPGYLPPSEYRIKNCEKTVHSLSSTDGIDYIQKQKPVKVNTERLGDLDRFLFPNGLLVMPVKN